MRRKARPNLPPVAGTYAVVHGATGQRYVGATVNLARREKSHMDALRLGRHWCRPLQALYQADPASLTFVRLTLAPDLRRNDLERWLYDSEQCLLLGRGRENNLNETVLPHTPKSVGKKPTHILIADFKRLCLSFGTPYRDELEAALDAARKIIESRNTGKHSVSQ